MFTSVFAGNIINRSYSIIFDSVVLVICISYIFSCNYRILMFVRKGWFEFEIPNAIIHSFIQMVLGVLGCLWYAWEYECSEFSMWRHSKSNPVGGLHTWWMDRTNRIVEIAAHPAWTPPRNACSVLAVFECHRMHPSVCACYNRQVNADIRTRMGWRPCIHYWWMWWGN